MNSWIPKMNKNLPNHWGTRRGHMHTRARAREQIAYTNHSSYLGRLLAYKSNQSNRKIIFFTIMIHSQICCILEVKTCCRSHDFGLIRSRKAHLTYCHMIVTTAGVGTSDSVYWTPWYSTSMQFTGHCYSQQQTFPFLWVQEMSLASDTSFQQQQLAKTVLRYLPNSLTFILNLQSIDSLIPTVLLIKSQQRLHRKYCSSVAFIFVGIHVVASPTTWDTRSS
jgi:hypothetical protein